MGAMARGVAIAGHRHKGAMDRGVAIAGHRQWVLWLEVWL